MSKIGADSSVILKLILSLLGLLTGLYLIFNASAPAFDFPYVSPDDTTEHVLNTKQPQPSENWLYIPKINVDLPIVAGDNLDVLEKGAWHRYPENGNPEKGGNFVLSAHRFTLGWTPQQTRKKSPFYNIDKLDTGDKIYVGWGGKRYEYEVTRRYDVPRTATEIEAPSVEAKMTLYSCDLRGEKAGREVIEAVLSASLL